MIQSVFPLLFAFSLWAGPSGDDPVQLRVTPSADFAPGAFRVTVTVEPHARNRTLTISMDSPVYRESMTRQLEGADAARTHVVRFDGVPAGQYLVEANVVRSDGSAHRAVADVQVYAELARRLDMLTIPQYRARCHDAETFGKSNVALGARVPRRVAG